MVTFIEGFDRGISAAKLSELSGSGTSWIVGGSSFENLARDDVRLESLGGDSASAIISKECLDIARTMVDTLQGATLPASESDTVGRIVVFADEGDETTGIPSVETCATALGLKPTAGGCDLRAESFVDAKDWSGSCNSAFCYDEDYMEQFEHEDDWSADDRKIVATTNAMVAELVDHFEFNMSDRIVCGPVLYGGRKDNTIIAVLSMRVWT
uniref:Uncharacterized protein n=1 Tax=Pseudo-nitzschia australis TaxID=44445 RepID=A0A7S4ALK0_9STRA|mmetsp:Transcript_510/g.1224  ORF Transcript_510/g.1224 Transcript_510/m.1224 type:complete len:212 (+) Transcript_510:105-740(+)